MDAKRQRLRRTQLDRQLLPLHSTLPKSLPTGGWIKTIREALGMNLAVFARRLGVAASTAHQLENAEAHDTLTLKRLRAAADALECDVAIVFLPRAPLSEIVERRAYLRALNQLKRVEHSMFMEEQGVSTTEFDEIVKETASEMLLKGEQIWE